MGYRATSIDSKFFISGEDKFAAFKALKTKWNFKKSRCLDQVLESFGFETKIDNDDNIVDIYYDCDKLNFDEDKMLSLIAPFVKSGSYIEMCGEDGERWRWVFENGELKEVCAKTTWGDDDEE